MLNGTQGNTLEYVRSLSLDEAIALLHGDRLGDLRRPKTARLYAMLTFSQGATHLAVAYLIHAIRLAPTDPSLYSDLGDVLLRMGRTTPAIGAHLCAIRWSGGDTHALARLGRALHSCGKHLEAIAIFSEILSQQPESCWLDRNLGDALCALGRTREGMAKYQKAISANPSDAESIARLGHAYLKEGRWEEALSSFAEAIRYEGQLAELHVGSSYALLGLGDYHHSRLASARALSLNPKDMAASRLFLRTNVLLDAEDATLAHAWLHLGEALETHGRIQECRSAYREAIAKKADCLKAHLGLGRVLLRAGTFAEAVSHLEAAIAIEPDNSAAHIDLGLALLGMGASDRGWDELVWSRRRWPERRRLTENPLWHGDALHGQTVLLWGDGVAETIQCLRFAKLVVARGGRVVVECDWTLVPMVRAMPEVDDVTIPDGPPVSWDLHAPLRFLPAFVHRARSSIQCRQPYLTVSRHWRQRWHRRLEHLRQRGEKLVAISWAGHTDPKILESIPLSAFSPLAGMCGIRFVSVQRGRHLHELLAPPNNLRIDCLLDDSNSLMDIAAVLVNADAVVTADMALAALAGSLGRPTIAILSNNAAWPWSREPDSVDWYPTVKLVRKRRGEEWSDVVSHVRDELRRDEWCGGEAARISAKGNRRTSRRMHPALATVNSGYNAAIVDAAENRSRELIKKAPDDWELWYTYGLLARRQGRQAVAARCLARAVHLGGRSSSLYANLGKALLACRYYAAAARAFLQALSLDPHNSAVMLGLARSLERVGAKNAAFVLSQEASRLARADIEPMVGAADVFEALGSQTFALKLYETSIRKYPVNSCAILAYGRALMRRHRWKEAIATFRRGLAIRRSPVLLIELGDALAAYGRHAAAVRIFREALIDDNSRVDAWQKLISAMTCLGESDTLSHAHVGLARALDSSDDFEGAGDCYKCALGTSSPSDTGAIMSNLARISLRLAQPEQAHYYANAAIARNADDSKAHANLARASYLLGDSTSAWREFSFHPLGSDEHHFEQARWDGSDIAGKTILLWQDQGLGDAIQYLRYAPLVRERVRRVYLLCNRRLAHLAERMQSFDGVLSFGMPLPDFDIHSPLFALPQIFSELGLKTPPCDVPYVHIETDLRRKWRDTVEHTCDSSKRTVGLVWGSRAGWTDARFRSMPLVTLRPLAERHDIQLVNLQLGPQTSELMWAPRAFQGMKQLFDDSCTMEDTAALIVALDLVVSVDTMVAHLAGALGSQVWTLLRYAADWRWLLRGDSSSWYPTMRLFRQKSAGDWNSVVAQIQQALDEM